ncbi:MAG: PilZ domain-containing protein [Desulfobacteraceae bacterium]|nr:PilZ domain-containing protein [Desulfobacteraceae bacterium]
MDEVEVRASETFLTIRCPSCKKEWKRNRKRFERIGSKYVLTCKCSCGEVFKAIHNRRRHARKACIFNGTYLHESTMKRGKMSLKDVSLSGAGLKVHSDVPLRVGDVLIVQFNMEDEEDYVVKQGVIKNVRDNYVGIEFFEQAHDKEILGSFLRE